MKTENLIQCPLCERHVPQSILEAHHLKTRRKDKKGTEKICRECHRQFHVLFGNNEIRNTELGLDTLEGILENEEFQRALKFIRKVPPGTSITVRESNLRGKRR
jgi:O6-methylguanine-DNA--protein-cysteine methyltransferase